MKTIGLLGGMSWESTREYYRLLNQHAASRFGGSHSAPCIVYSFDFAPIEALQQRAEWTTMGTMMAAGAQALERAGAQLLVLCSNTMHAVAPEIEAAARVPFVHIVDAAAAELQQAGARRAALLGTRHTMESAFYRERLSRLFGIETVVPDEAERAIVHDIIYGELIRGIVTERSHLALESIADRLVSDGADALLLGCTELGMQLSQDDAAVPVVDTTKAHAAYAFLEAARDE